MEINFTAISKLTLTVGNSDEMPKIKHVDLLLQVGQGLEKSAYMNSDNLPTRIGSRAATTALVHGLIANIHHAHEARYRDSAEHLRFIIAELTRGFAEVVTISEGEMDVPQR